MFSKILRKQKEKKRGQVRKFQTNIITTSIKKGLRMETNKKNLHNMCIININKGSYYLFAIFRKLQRTE